MAAPVEEGNGNSGTFGRQKARVAIILVERCEHVSTNAVRQKTKIVILCTNRLFRWNSSPFSSQPPLALLSWRLSLNPSTNTKTCLRQEANKNTSKNIYSKARCHCIGVKRFVEQLYGRRVTAREQSNGKPQSK